MKTKFGELSSSAVYARIEECRQIGRKAFLGKYTNGYGAKSTWLSFNGELFPAKAIFKAAFLPIELPKSFQTSDTYVFAREIGLELIVIRDGVPETTRSAIDDTNQSSDENDDPKYRDIMLRSVVRDYNVRRRVLERANGQCEYGSSELTNAKCNTFIKRDGNVYLEAHHILKLSDDGKDEDSNVIAVCANHHREAHSGNNWETLNEQFQKIVDEKMKK